MRVPRRVAREDGAAQGARRLRGGCRARAALFSVPLEVALGGKDAAVAAMVPAEVLLLFAVALPAAARFGSSGGWAILEEG